MRKIGDLFQWCSAFRLRWAHF